MLAGAKFIWSLARLESFSHHFLARSRADDRRCRVLRRRVAGRFRFWIRFSRPCRDKGNDVIKYAPSIMAHSQDAVRTSTAILLPRRESGSNHFKK
jgi:hypothetical protein